MTFPIEPDDPHEAVVSDDCGEPLPRCKTHPHYCRCRDCHYDPTPLCAAWGNMIGSVGHGSPPPGAPPLW